MKAMIYTDVKSLALEDVLDPVPADDEVLVRVEYVGICGSDMHAYLGHDERRPAPLILGHEAAGVVVSGTPKGQRVTVNPLVTCGHCAACTRGEENLCPNRQIISMPPRAGAFAEMIAIPTRNLVNIPDDIPLEIAALCEPLACGWHAVRKCEQHLGAYFLGSNALVQGGGAIGLGAALALKAWGIEQITIVELHEGRAQFLREQLEFHVLANVDDHPAEFDLVIDGVGFGETRAVASAKVRPGGVIAHIGLGSNDQGLDIRRLTLQDITFMGCYTYSREDFRETAEAIFSGQLGTLDWAEIRSLEEGPQAFADILNGAVIAPKIILKP